MYDDTPPDMELLPAIVTTYQLRDYQESAVQAALNFCKYQDGNGYLVLPTASGKSVVMAKLAERLEGRVLLLAHRKELLEQNASKFSPHESVGIYSTGLGRWETDRRITVAGIQSIVNDPPENITWVIIDEVHRLPDKQEGQYWDLIKALGNPRVIGFTATNFRLDGGYLKWGTEIFKIGYQPLIDKGYLCKLINKVPFEVQFLSDVKLGDYVLSQLEDELIDPELLRASVLRIAHYSIDRRSVLIFVATLKHGRLLQAAMKENGLYAIMVDGSTPADERAQIAEEFKHGEIQYVINCQIWTEGFDAPNIDMIAVLRPTKSKALHEQILGRGVRIHPEKQNCLLLDMAGNLMEHGGLGTPFVEKGKSGTSKAQGKICPTCETLVKILDKECPDCGYMWPITEDRKVTHNYSPDMDSDTIYKGGAPDDGKQTHQIKEVFYFEHKSKAGNMGLRIDYVHDGYYGGKTSEYLSTHHENEWLRDKAWKFFDKRGIKLPKQIEEHTIPELIELAQGLKKPTSITTAPQKGNPKYTEIVGYGWEPSKTEVIELDLEDEILF